MSCFWDGILKGLNSNGWRFKKKEFIEFLKRENKLTKNIMWNNSSLREQEMDENYEAVENYYISGIYNVGTGKSHSFNDIANAVIKRRKTGRIKYIPFPKELEESYQSYTEANLKNLRSVGYKKEFIALDEGVSTYLDAIY